MDILINITTYKRRRMLRKLLTPLKFHTFVWDDDPNSKTKTPSDFYHRFRKNYGKKEAWKKYNMMFNVNKRIDYDYYIFIPDDVELSNEQIEQVVEIWKKIDDPSKICLSFLTDKRVQKPNWTGVEPIPMEAIILTQWNDLCFICERKFFNEVGNIEVDSGRWETNELLGSGVGSKISNNLFEKGFNMYHTKESFCKHIGKESKMNPKERKNNPLL